MILKRTVFAALPAAMILTLAACGGGGPSGTVDDGRPEGTFRVRYLFSHFCDLSEGGTAYLYTNHRKAGGELVDSQRIENRELNFYLPPQTRRSLVIVVGGEEVVEEEIFWASDRDVQKDSIVCQ
jgi:hypothetical protein